MVGMDEPTPVGKSGRRGPSGRGARGRKPGAGPEPVFEWDRRYGEGPESYEAFLVYRDLRPEERSHRRVRERYGKGAGKRPPSIRLLEKWSARWSWTFRVDAWDAHIQRLRDEKLREVLTADIESYRLLEEGARQLTLKGLELNLRKLAAIGTDEKGNPKDPDAVPSYSSVISAANRLVDLRAKVVAMEHARLEKLQAEAGPPAFGAREELARRLDAMVASRGAASAAIEKVAAVDPAVEALKAPDGGTPAPAPSA